MSYIPYSIDHRVREYGEDFGSSNNYVSPRIDSDVREFSEDYGPKGNYVSYRVSSKTREYGEDFELLALAKAKGSIPKLTDDELVDEYQLECLQKTLPVSPEKEKVKEDSSDCRANPLHEADSANCQANPLHEADSADCQANSLHERKKQQFRPLK